MLVRVCLTRENYYHRSICTFFAFIFICLRNSRKSLAVDLGRSGKLAAILLAMSSHAFCFFASAEVSLLLSSTTFWWILMASISPILWSEVKFSPRFFADISVLNACPQRNCPYTPVFNRQRQLKMPIMQWHIVKLWPQLFSLRSICKVIRVRLNVRWFNLVKWCLNVRLDVRVQRHFNMRLTF